MEKGCIVIVILAVSIIHVTMQNDVGSTQISGLLDVTGTLWHNESCDDICACVTGIMEGMRTDQVCLGVTGYPCHLVKQLTMAATTKNCSVTVGRNWFECDKGVTECVGGAGVTVDDQANCTAGSDERAAGNIAYLGCEAKPSTNTSVMCMLSRDSQSVGQCVNTAQCVYKKERVSCPMNWIPYKKHCLSPINGILQKNILDQKTWAGAQNYCQKRWHASLISLESLSEGALRGFEVKGIFVTDQEVWLGLYRNASTNFTFRWVDDTEISQPEASWPWAEGHPMPGLNHVYILNKTLYSAESSRVNRYSCKIKVSKSLNCRQPTPTELPLTTTMEAVGPSSTHPPTSPKTKDEETLAAFRKELTQVRDDVSNYLKTFTNDTTVLEAIDGLMDMPEYSSLNASSEKKAKDQSTSIIKTIDSMVDGLAESINKPTKPLVISTPEIVLKVMTLCSDCEEGEALGGQLGNQSFSLSLPDSVKTAGATLALSTAGLLHQQLPSTIDGGGEKGGTEIGSLVTSISLRRWDGERIELTKNQPLKLTFSSLEKYPDSMPTCRYWKVAEGTEGVWSSEGCFVAKSNDTHTTCDITHLTSFAVIMQISHNKDNQPIALDYLTWAGCALSITCLTIMLIIFFSQRMYRADRNIIHMNLAASLLLAQLIFVLGIDRTKNEGVCKAVGICVHFFLLATFFWMLNEGIFLLSKTTSAKTRWLRLPTYFTIGWVCPLVIVGITMAVSFDSYDTAERCWLTVQDGGIWAFVGPAAGVVLINICVLVQVIRVFLSLRANMNKKKVERIRIALRAILLTLPLLGCTWLVGMLFFNSSTLVFAYIFVILNSLQGVFIFILYCILNDEVRSVMRTRSERKRRSRSAAYTPPNTNDGKLSEPKKTDSQKESRAFLKR